MTNAIILIVLLSLASCKGGGSGGSSAKSGGNAAEISNLTGQYFSKPDVMRRHSAFGSAIDYSCNNESCTVSGKLESYYQNSSNVIVYIEFFNSELTLNADGNYYGQAEYNNPPHVGSIGVTLGSDFKIKYLDNGLRCLSVTEELSQDDYDAFIDGKTLNNYYQYGPINFNDAPLKSNCGM